MNITDRFAYSEPCQDRGQSTEFLCSTLTLSFFLHHLFPQILLLYFAIPLARLPPRHHMLIISVIFIRTLLFFRPFGNNLPYSMTSFQKPFCWHKDWDNVRIQMRYYIIYLSYVHLGTEFLSFAYSKLIRYIKWKSIVLEQWVLAFWHFWILK